MKLTIITHPNASKEKIEIDLLGQLHIYVKAPPLEGKANHAVISLLSQHFNQPPSHIQLISGHKSKFKIFEIAD